MSWGLLILGFLAWLGLGLAVARLFAFCDREPPSPQPSPMGRGGERALRAPKAG